MWRSRTHNNTMENNFQWCSERTWNLPAVPGGPALPASPLSPRSPRRPGCPTGPMGPSPPGRPRTPCSPAICEVVSCTHMGQVHKLESKCSGSLGWTHLCPLGHRVFLVSHLSLSHLLHKNTYLKAVSLLISGVFECFLLSGW